MRSIRELQDLTGKVALISGGGGYLGTAMSEALSEAGATIIVASRNVTELEGKAKALEEKTGNKVIARPLDVLDHASIDDLATFVETNFGKLDILINNAWSGRKNSFESISEEDWNYDIDICLNGPFRMVKAMFEQLKAAKGVILNTASMYGVVAPDSGLYEGNAYSNPPSYGAAKAGIVQFTRYLASFLAKHEIRVNAVSPGPFPFGATLEDREFISRLENKTMLKRIGDPEDMKGIALYLCSDLSRYVTGQNFSVDGGWTSW